MNMEIATTFEALKFRVTHNLSISQFITAHLNVAAWQHRLSKLL